MKVLWEEPVHPEYVYARRILFALEISHQRLALAYIGRPNVIRRGQSWVGGLWFYNGDEPLGASSAFQLLRSKPIKDIVREARVKYNESQHSRHIPKAFSYKFGIFQVDLIE